ncbi:hypothetical protein ACFSYD_17510 [Paracoccus aerius]
MMKLSLQLYSARFATPYADVIRRLGALGYDAAEGYGGVFDDLPAIAEALSAAGMTMPSLHVSLDLIEENPERVAQIAGQVGATMIFAPISAPTSVPRMPQDGRPLPPALPPRMGRWPNGA